MRKQRIREYSRLENTRSLPRILQTVSGMAEIGTVAALLWTQPLGLDRMKIPKYSFCSWVPSSELELNLKLSTEFNWF